MIKIQHPEIAYFANRHYEAIENHLKKAHKKNRLPAINERLNNIFGDSWDLKKIILASPEEMEKLIQKWDRRHNADFSYFITTLYEEFSSGKKLFLKNGDEKTFYGAILLVEDLDISVCPYCNRNFIFNTDKYGKRTCDMDHFFPKNTFSFLAISFFNLIPSCKFCNGIKLDKWNTCPEKMLLNPYDTRFSFDVKFKVKITGAAFYHKEGEIEIDFDDENIPQRLENHIKAFYLKQLYQKHRDYVIELIQKKYTYNEEYISALYKQYEGTLFRNQEDLLRLLTTNYIDEKDLKNRPLAKLTKDIVEQLDL